MMANSSTRYTRTAIILHWVVAFGLVVNVVLGLSTDYVGDENIRMVIDTHKSMGITLLGFVLLRLSWRVSHKPPVYPYQQPNLERFLASATHLSLYGLMLLIPLSGWLHDSAWKAASEIKMYWFGLFEWPRIAWVMQVEPEAKERLHDLFGSMHQWFSYMLYGLVALHISAALMHHFSNTQRVRGRGILP